MSIEIPQRPPEDENIALRARIAELEGRVAELEPYSAFFDKCLAMLCLARDNRFVRLNRAWEDTLGWSLEELCARPYVEFVHPEDVARTHEKSAMLEQGMFSLAFENRYRCKDGSYRHLRWFSAPPDDSGYHHAIAQDITEQRRAEERARVYEDTIMRSATGMLVLQLDRPGDPTSLRLIMANDAATRYCGLDLRPEVGRVLSDVFTNVAATGLPEIYTELAMQGGSRDIGEVVYDDPRVAQGVFSVRAFALPDLRVCINFENVTERKKTEAALRQSIRQEEIIRAQAATLAELSTPLIPVSDDVVVMPLIGTVDSTRAAQVIETLLGGIVERRAKTAILDITGVAVVDTQVADALVRAARGVKLLGARVMLTGIRPEVARTLVELAVDLGGIKTYGSLQAGIAAAFGGTKPIGAAPQAERRSGQGPLGSGV